MQGRQGKDKEIWDKASSSRLAALNGSGKQRERAMPKRPPRMAHVETAPSIPRVARPQRQAPPPTKFRRRLLIWSAVLIVCALLAWIIGYATVNFINATNVTAGAATTATSFLSNISTQDYEQAYNSLAADITVKTQPEDFTRQAQSTDHCYGTMTDYKEVENSANVSADGKTQSYTYTITRTKARPYQLTLSLQQDQYGNWKITGYGNNDDLGPGQSPCS